MQHFEWAFMNLATRCFGHYHMPNEIAMVPLMDLCNHAEEQGGLRFFLTPTSLNKLMLETDIAKQTNAELEKDAYETMFLGTTQRDEELG